MGARTPMGTRRLSYMVSKEPSGKNDGGPGGGGGGPPTLPEPKSRFENGGISCRPGLGMVW